VMAALLVRRREFTTRIQEAATSTWAALREVRPIPPELSGTYSYRIPGVVMADAMKRSGLARAQMDKALNLDASDSASTCNARIALRDAILAQPQRTALPIMRDMES